MTHFLPAPAVGHQNQQSLLHRHALPLIVGHPVCATACRRACGNNTRKLKHRLLLIHTSGIPAMSLWAAQESENKTLNMWSGPCLWPWGNSGTSLSSPGLPSYTYSKLCHQLPLCLPCDLWTLQTSPSSLSLATCLVEDKVRIPMAIYSFYRCCTSSWHTPASTSGGSSLDER